MVAAIFFATELDAHRKSQTKKDRHPVYYTRVDIDGQVQKEVQ